jgi:UDP:flavonoid glycosyltransferase YjiC (YdhE family)
MRRPSVDPAFSFGVSLFVSAVLWYPTLRGAMAGSIDITDAGIRYFVALAISWAGVFGICSLVAMYASEPRRPTPPPGVPTDAPQRRRADAPAAETQPAITEDEPSAA